ncbi:TPA: replication terminator protein [Bacillus cereus]|uniref:hypothetical protein n=1 Tax=Bacillus cereus TaxID=1396 RepID=UPI0007AC0CB2|nr:hypothetical protein [Bacillus cereus]KZD72347.1 hypothetical protein B4120_4778 [Bacillus cereus]MDA4083814.1 replication terminator protein [Bacillus cereus]
MIDLNSFANGALAEQFNSEFQKVMENMSDINTDPKKARKIVITLSITGNDKRDVCACKVQTKSTLVPADEVESKILINHDASGNVIGQELLSGVKGQMFISTEGEVLDHVGERVQ